MGEVRDGQAQMKGIQVGMIMLRIDGQPYSKELLMQKLKGSVEYTIVFKSASAAQKARQVADAPGNVDVRITANEAARSTASADIFYVEGMEGMTADQYRQALDEKMTALQMQREEADVSTQNTQSAAETAQQAE